MMPIETKYPHLSLTDWPFRIVPDEAFCDFMADRASVQQDLANFLRNMSRKPMSSMHLLFAWYGCGKTHTLRYLEYLCNKHPDKNILSVYTDFPKSAKGFFDLYTSLMKKIDMEILKEKYVEIFSDENLKDKYVKILSETPFLMNVLGLLYMGNRVQQELSIRWLRGEDIDLRILKSNLGISKTINNLEDSINIIASIIGFFKVGPSPKKILWMIDEFQRVDDCKKNVREEIYGCLTAVLNRCPQNLSIVFSSSTKSLEIPKEIADRIGMEKIIALPLLSEGEAITFVHDLLSKFRSADFNSAENPVFPFTEESVQEIIHIICEKGGKLKPRTLMQAFNAVLEEADLPIEKNKMKLIESDFARKILKDRDILDKGTEGIDEI